MTPSWLDLSNLDISKQEYLPDLRTSLARQISESLSKAQDSVILEALEKNLGSPLPKLTLLLSRVSMVLGHRIKYIFLDGQLIAGDTSI